MLRQRFNKRLGGHFTKSRKHILPDTPGIYIFRDTKKRPMYIGRATSLRDRVKSYFKDDIILTRGPRIVDMIVKSRSLDWQKTDSVLEAILLESNLIKKYQPYFNIDEKDDKSGQYVIITDEEWPRVFPVRVRDLETDIREGKLSYRIKKKFGPFPQGGLVNDALKILRRIFPFKDKNAYDLKYDVFYQAIGKSPTGIVSERSQHPPTRLNSVVRCVSEGGSWRSKRDNSCLQGDRYNSWIEYKKTINQLILFFEGKKDMVRKKLEKEMAMYANKLQFERAGEIKKSLYAIDHINDIALISRDEYGGQTSVVRIEAYDIAHLSGTNVVGAMVVSIGGEFVKGEYRKFKLSEDKNDDLRNLAEVFRRRLRHSEWAYPDLIVVDGNQMQIKVVESILKIYRIPIPVVAVTKDNRHRANKIIGNREFVSKFKKEILSLNIEAHRFAIKYHRQRRSNSY
ncbi:MAG: hypothetical protein WCW03_01040 [Candidatus Paceibacterota bacterium]|jgi:excinuclease ABC subunit C